MSGSGTRAVSTPAALKNESGRETEMTKAATADSDPLVVIVIPTYNEAANLDELTRRIFTLGIPNLRIIFIDDGSPDGTGEAAEKLSGRYGGRVEVVQRGGKLGLGTAYVRGFSQALSEGADYVLQMDADLSHPPEAIPALLDKLSEAEVVVGSRYVEDGGVDESWSLSRRALSYFGNLGIRLITGLRVRDATSGFKAFQAGALRALDMAAFRCTGFAFQAEMAHACQRSAYTVAEHPIIFMDRTRGKSKMSLAIVVEAVLKLLPLRWSQRR